MTFKTYAEIRDKVEIDLDLQDEEFVQAEELLGYCNEAIKAAESIILKLCQDYFLDVQALTLVSGTQKYSLPSDIFADKIRKIIYANGTTIYTVRRMRFSGDFENVAWENQYGNTGQPYRYLMTNNLTLGRKMSFYPSPVESGAYMQIWYLRSARQVVADTDEVDIPEFHGFIEQFMKVRCYEKEGNVKLGDAEALLAAEKQLMVETLTDRFPDDDTELEADLSHYQESV